MYENISSLTNLSKAALSVGLVGLTTIMCDASNMGMANHAVNLRTGPSVHYKYLALIPKNAEVKILGSSGNWLKVEYKNKVGYSYGKYINSTNCFKGNVTAKHYLSVRESPTISAHRLATLHHNDTVYIMGTVSNWYKINYNGRVGYVLKSFVDVNSTPSTNNSQSVNKTPSTNTTQDIKNMQPAYINLSKTSYRITFLRSRASFSGNKLARMTNNSKIYLVNGFNSQSSWTKVKYNNTTGYCYTKYVDIKDNTSSPSVSTSQSNTQQQVEKVESSPSPQVNTSSKPQQQVNTNTVYEINSYAFKQVVENEMYRLINQYRSNNGLNRYSISSDLENTAFTKSKDMVEKDYFDHYFGGKLIWQYKNVLRANAENIAYNYIIPQNGYYKVTEKEAKDLANRLFTQWKNSPGHNAAMLKSYYKKMGFSVYVTKKNSSYYTVYATQEFKQ